MKSFNMGNLDWRYIIKINDDGTASLEKNPTDEEFAIPASENRIKIELGIQGYNEPRQINVETLSDGEKKAFKIIGDILTKSNLDFGKVRLERRSENYTTLVVGERNDFCRMRIGKRAKWISLDLWYYAQNLASDERLTVVKNKNQRHWKIPLESVNDIKKYADLIVLSFQINQQKFQS